MATKAARLVGITGECAGKVFPLVEKLLIGRFDSADIRIPNLEVSRRHCQIDRVGDDFQITDLSSRSGTKLNDAPVHSSPILPGDLLGVGPNVFRFEVDSAPDISVPAEINSRTLAIDDPEAQLTLKEILASDFNLAKQIGKVTEQATLERLRKHLELVQDFAETIQTTLETTALIERTLDELFHVFSKMDAGVIFLRDNASGQLTPAAIRQREDVESGPVGYSTTILRSVESERKAVIILDVSQDARFQHAASVQMGSMRTHMCVPLIVRQEVVGAIYLVAEGGEKATAGFDTDDLALLSALSGTVAVCVKNATLAREAQRNAQLSSGLQRYVSADVTRRLIEQGVQGALGARTAEGTAMFCDLVGFTSLAEQLTPDRMAKLLNRYFRRALEVVFARNGSVNKFGGDSFLAIWGAIDPAPNDLENALRAALEIQNETFRLSAELAAEGIGRIQLTIGLIRGRFFAGDIGSDDRMEFTVIGDPVNVASRIQALAHGGQVLTTTDTLGLASSQMSLVLYPTSNIRGRSAKVTIASVRSILSHKSPEGSRLLASIPVRILELEADGILIEGAVGNSAEVELVEVLCNRPAEVGGEYNFVTMLPEWEAKPSPATAVCVASMAEDPVYLVKLRVTAATEELTQMLTPGSERVATRSLRKKD